MAENQAVAAAFGMGGPLAASVPEYRPREGQLQMAQAVAQVIAQGGKLVVEAGTGVGKTYAYLVPALLSGKRVLVSTATKALQDQLFGRDIPRLRELLGVSLRVALLKGRGSYLCLHHLESARQDWRLDDGRTLHQLARIESWAHATQTGDLSEVEALDDSSPLMPLVTSTRENCLGARCPQFSRCFVNTARREALAADLVVINHHLFFADLNVRESGVAELLPSVHTVIFDEAHQLNEIGVQFLGRQLGSGQLSNFARDLERVAQEHARGLAPWPELAQAIEQGAEALRSRFPVQDAAARMEWRVVGERWNDFLQACQASIAHAHDALDMLVETAPELQVLQQRCSDLMELLQLFLQPIPPGAVRWLEVGRQVRMLQSPMDVSQAMQTRVFAQQEDATAGAGKSWIFTSATLGHDDGLSWIVESCGLAGAHVLKVPSPFDYARQAALYVPSHFSKPGDASHSHAVAQLALEGARQLGGRTLVLTTTLRAMRTIGDALATAMQGHSDLELLVQGVLPKRELLSRFLQHGEDRQRGAILVASATFWEGIDMPGEALQLLVIDKLPFTPPDDPVMQARSRSLENQGKNPFKHLHLPQAAVALRQGAGRLIRRESDQGVLVVCDTRLIQMGYGRQLLATLPAMRRLNNEADYRQALEALTRASTKDHC
jgi:ATP-dependent DNA helicase DinG